MDEVDKLIEILHKHPDPRKRARAALDLGDYGDDSALEPLIYHLQNDEHDFVRRDCAEALGLLEMEEAVDALLTCIKEDDFRFARNEAVESLGKIGDSRAIPALLEFMKNEDWEFAQASAAISLAHLGAEDALEFIHTLLEGNGDNFLKRDLLNSIKIFKKGVSRPTLFKLALNDEDWEVRQKSVEILGFLSAPETIEVLVEVLKTDKHIFVKQEAEKALQQIANDNNLQWSSAEALLSKKDKIEIIG